MSKLVGRFSRLLAPPFLSFVAYPLLLPRPLRTIVSFGRIFVKSCCPSACNALLRARLQFSVGLRPTPPRFHVGRWQLVSATKDVFQRCRLALPSDTARRRSIRASPQMALHAARHLAPIEGVSKSVDHMQGFGRPVAGGGRRDHVPRLGRRGRPLDAIQQLALRRQALVRLRLLRSFFIHRGGRLDRLLVWRVYRPSTTMRTQTCN